MTTERKDIVPASFPRSASGEGVLDSLAKALLFDDHGKGDAKEDRDMKRPVSQFVDAMLTDLYQITMAYGYWLSDRHDEDSVFDCFFRENPFSGEFTIFAGLEEVLRHVQTFRFTEADIAELQKRFPSWKKDFWVWLKSVDSSKIRIFAIDEGSVVFPRIPLLRVEGPLAICQLLETTILVLVNYASLVCTNAARHRLAVGPDKQLLEFGLRRAQGPDGAMSASRYSYVGGFDSTSNVKAALLFGLNMAGTHAHSFVVSFSGMHDLKRSTLENTQGKEVDFVSLVKKYNQTLKNSKTNQGELAAFTAYAQAFPAGFLALVDTYDTLQSGLWNFLSVALALNELGYKARGIRLDSGDLAYLSTECRKAFKRVATEHKCPELASATIVASNDLSEEVLWSLKEQGHEIDAFGIGTNLVTCLAQPALGCVYKLVQVKDTARIKLSQDAVKVTIPGKKEAYRLFNARGEPVVDMLISVGSPAPVPTKKVLCRSPFDPTKRAYVIPTKVVPLHSCVWDGKLTKPLPTLQECRQRVTQQLASMRPDHVRRMNPTPYKISVSADLYTFMHELWLQETPIAEIS